MRARRRRRSSSRTTAAASSTAPRRRSSRCPRSSRRSTAASRSSSTAAIRRGTDVVKALALGARAVLVGRPVLWGLAVGGEQGVAARARAAPRRGRARPAARRLPHARRRHARARRPECPEYPGSARFACSSLRCSCLAAGGASAARAADRRHLRRPVADAGLGRLRRPRRADPGQAGHHDRRRLRHRRPGADPRRGRRDRPLRPQPQQARRHDEQPGRPLA